MFYDTTSTCFEGEEADEEIAKRGFSKDHRSDRKQVLIELLMTKQGNWSPSLPWQYARYKNVWEVIKDRKKRYPIDKVLLVGDRGMVSEENWCGFYLTCIRYYKKLSEQFVQSLKVPDT